MRYEALDQQSPRKKDIHFHCVVILTCDEKNERCFRELQELLEPDSFSSTGFPQSRIHPFIDDACNSHLPYATGNGGLLNPILRWYMIEGGNISTEEQFGGRFIVSGVVSADGLAPQELDSEHPSSKYEPRDTYTHTPSLLEEAVLGALQEQLVDYRLNYIDPFYRRGAPPSSESYEHRDLFTQCIKHAWTSKNPKQYGDNGKLAPECHALIKRHFPRSYPSYIARVYNGRRPGEHKRIWLTAYVPEAHKDETTAIHVEEVAITVSNPNKCPLTERRRPATCSVYKMLLCHSGNAYH